MSANPQDASAHFVGKWLHREPEMAFAEPFCASADKARFRAWGALLHELREALFELSDLGVARAKTAWWAEELLAMARGQARHPLGQALQPLTAPWPALARALVEAPLDGERAADTRAAIAELSSLAAAVIEVESALFGVAAQARAGQALSVHWLLQRLPAGLESGDQARLPMQMLARHGMDPSALTAEARNALLRDWSAELLLACPEWAPGAPWLRRARLGFDRIRLQKLASTGLSPTASPLLCLWRAWGMARRA